MLALVKGKERYVFMYNESNRAKMVELFARYASDSALSFSWYDAAVLAQRVRAESRKAEIAEARAVNRLAPEREEKKPLRRARSVVGGEFDPFNEMEDL